MFSYKSSLENFFKTYIEHTEAVKGDMARIQGKYESVSNFLNIVINAVNRYGDDVRELKAEIKAMRPWRPTDASLTYEELIEEVTQLKTRLDRRGTYGRNDTAADGRTH